MEIMIDCGNIKEVEVIKLTNRIADFIEKDKVGDYVKTISVIKKVRRTKESA